MTTLFETIRHVFFIITILMIIFLVTQNQTLNNCPSLETGGLTGICAINTVLMPAYLILMGLVIGYILHLLGQNITVSSNNFTQNQYTHAPSSVIAKGLRKRKDTKSKTTSYIQGLIIGIFLALLYIFIM